MSKIKYYKNIKLEEFLDETVKKCIKNEKIVDKLDEINLNLNKTDDYVEIIYTDELASEITFDITNINGEKKVILTVNIYDEADIIKIDFEIIKSTLEKLLKDLED